MAFKTRKYEVVWHFDVWGNPEDGFDVNDSCRLGVLRIPEKASNKDLFDLLCRWFQLEGDFDKVEFSEPGDFIQMDGKDGRPYLTLTPVS